MRSKITDKK